MGCTALTRGRESNHLFLAGTRSKWRDEFAPCDPEPPDPIAQLARALSTSNAQTLAIDASPLFAARQELRRLEGVRAAAERDEADAVRTRRKAEARLSRWRPKTRLEPEAARLAESAAAQRATAGRSRESAQAERVRALQDDHVGRPTRTLQLRLERDHHVGRSAER